MRTWRVYEAYRALDARDRRTMDWPMALLALVVVFVAGVCLGTWL